MASRKSPQEHALRLRDGLVVVLALTTGAVDAVTYMRLGKVFSSVITGNLALLGIAVGHREGGLAVSGGVALAGYGLGVFVGRAVAGESPDDQRIWPLRSTVALVAELLVLAGFSAGWLATAGSPAGSVRVTLIGVAAAGMGMQSSAVRRLGRMSSTYLTATLTSVLEALAILRWPSDWQRSTGVLLALVAGAALGASASAAAEPLVPVAVMVPVLFVVACSSWSPSLHLTKEREGHEGRASETPERSS